MTWRHRATAGVIVAVVALIYILRLDDVAGLMLDDAWYIILGKALAQGDGFRLISSAATPILPSVPPGFPALLAIVFAFNPAFPGNLVWMKLISVAAVAATAAMLWFDWTRHRGLSAANATLLVVATALTPSLVFLATSTVMADCVFMFAQVGAVILVERITRRDSTDAPAAVLAGVAAALAMLIRAAGIAVIVAALVYLVLARRWRQAGIFAATVLICMLPWQWYAQRHAPTFEERLAHGGTIAFSYQQLLSVEHLGDPESAASVSSLAGRALRNVAEVASRDIGALVLPSIYRTTAESGLETISVGGPRGGSMGRAPQTMVISTLLTLIVLSGWLFTPGERVAMPGLLLLASIGMVTPVASETVRYFIPLLPYLFLLLWRGLRGGNIARIVLLVAIGFEVLDHSGYIGHQRAATAEWLADAREMNELMTWINTNVADTSAVAATNPGYVYLSTGRKAVVSAFLERNIDRWRAAGIRYIVSTLPAVPLPQEVAGAKLLYRTSHHGFWIVKI